MKNKEKKYCRCKDSDVEYIGVRIVGSERIPICGVCDLEVKDYLG